MHSKSDFVYKMKIAYDGTLYGGWQSQINTTSIQSVIECALSTAVRCPLKIVGSGRTDAGVHALGQVAHFKHREMLDRDKLLASLNGLLPPDIRILALDLASPTFHARFSAQSKLYHYHLHLDPASDPFQRLYTHRPPHPVNLELMTQATHYFIGTRDFTSFANVRDSQAAQSDPPRNVRTLYRLEILQEEKGVCLAFEGNGFLYKMVRNIVGALLDVSRGKSALDDIDRIFAAKDRRKAGIAAPAQGLFLVDVRYPNA